MMTCISIGLGEDMRGCQVTKSPTLEGWRKRRHLVLVSNFLLKEDRRTYLYNSELLSVAHELHGNGQYEERAETTFRKLCNKLFFSHRKHQAPCPHHNLAKALR